MYRHTLVHHFLEHSAARLPGKVALVHQGRRFTYSELETLATRLARALAAHGVGKGERVAVFMDNAVETVVAIFAALKAGAAFMVIHPGTKAAKLGYILANSQASALLTQSGRAEVVKESEIPPLKLLAVAGPAVPGLAGVSFAGLLAGGEQESTLPAVIDLDLAALIYTSGSTGQPKGVALSHANMVSAAHSITSYLENNEEEVILNLLPLSFDYGLYQVLMAFLIGGTVVLEKGFTYPHEAVAIMARERVTGLPGVPTIFALLLGMKNLASYELPALRYLTNTAAALPVSHIRRLRQAFPQAKLYSMYGLTECKRVSYLPPEELERRPNSIGRGMPNEEVYLVNETGERSQPGEIGTLVVRGANVMLGYWGLPADTERCLRPGPYGRERVLYTGDLFRQDAEGFLYFVARQDDLIKCKGEKVSPKEIENVLYGLEGILEAAVAGVPDPILGQAVKAWVALEEGARLGREEILRHCARQLEPLLVPKYIEIRASLPKTATGKISRRELEQEAEKRREERP